VDGGDTSEPAAHRRDHRPCLPALGVDVRHEGGQAAVPCGGHPGADGLGRVRHVRREPAPERVQRHALEPGSGGDSIERLPCGVVGQRSARVLDAGEEPGDAGSALDGLKQGQRLGRQRPGREATLGLRQVRLAEIATDVLTA
jgi:hypothetical protein